MVPPTNRNLKRRRSAAAAARRPGRNSSASTPSGHDVDPVGRDAACDEAVADEAVGTHNSSTRLRRGPTQARHAAVLPGLHHHPVPRRRRRPVRRPGVPDLDVRRATAARPAGRRTSPTPAPGGISGPGGHRDQGQFVAAPDQPPAQGAVDPGERVPLPERPLPDDRGAGRWSGGVAARRLALARTRPRARTTPGAARCSPSRSRRHRAARRRARRRAAPGTWPARRRRRTGRPGRRTPGAVRPRSTGPRGPARSPAARARGRQVGPRQGRLVVVAQVARDRRQQPVQPPAQQVGLGLDLACRRTRVRPGGALPLDAQERVTRRVRRPLQIPGVHAAGEPTEQATAPPSTATSPWPMPARHSTSPSAASAWPGATPAARWKCRAESRRRSPSRPGGRDGRRSRPRRRRPARRPTRPPTRPRIRGRRRARSPPRRTPPAPARIASGADARGSGRAAAGRGARHVVEAVFDGPDGPPPAGVEGPLAAATRAPAAAIFCGSSSWVR